LDLAGGIVLAVRRSIAPLVVAVVAFHAVQGFAQGAFPAPLPGQAAPSGASPFPPVNGASPFPPVNGASPVAGAPRSSFPVTGAAPIGGGGFAPPTQQGESPEQCMKAFFPLRAEAEKRGKMIKAASDHHSGPDVACKLIGNFSEVEIKMVKFVEANSARCGIPPQVADQLRNGHKNTEAMQQKVCAVAQQQQQAPAGPSLSEVLGSAASLPEAATAKKSGGSTFDTLSGNVLAR
jgi:hypothetical protein